jgi:predicted Zn-dependent peptidase
VKNIEDYVHRHIFINNITLSINCPVADVGKTKKMIEKYFAGTRLSKGHLKYASYIHENKGLKIIYVRNPYPVDGNVLVRFYVNTPLKFLGLHHIHLIFLNEMLFNFQTGIFYNVLRKELGLIYDISLITNVDIMHPKASTYYMQTSVKIQDVPKLIRSLIGILNSYEVTDEVVHSTKNALFVQYENMKFNDLTSYNAYYETFTLHKIPITERSEVSRKIQNVSKRDIVKA